MISLEIDLDRTRIFARSSRFNNLDSSAWARYILSKNLQESLIIKYKHLFGNFYRARSLLTRYCASVHTVGFAEKQSESTDDTKSL